MKKRTQKKVIIITTVIIIMAIGGFIFLYLQNNKNIDNSDQEYLAIQKIDLPNGITTEIQFAASTPTLQGWIGANLTELTQEITKHLNYKDAYGVYVQDTLRDSPAQTAGILPGDIITNIDQQETSEVIATIKLIASLNPGDSHQFTVFRQGKYLEYTVIITPKQHFS